MSERDESDTDPDRDDERAGRLDEMEQRLERQEQELADRERELEEREQELLERREENVELRERLEDRETELDDREQSIADREAALNERESEIEQRERDLAQREETLSQYVGDQLDELESSLEGTVDASVQSAMKRYGGSTGGRFGRIGALVLAFVGMALVVAGVVVALSIRHQDIPPVFATELRNLAAATVLVFSGLATNAAAAAGSR